MFMNINFYIDYKIKLIFFHKIISKKFARYINLFLLFDFSDFFDKNRNFLS